MPFRSEDHLRQCLKAALAQVGGLWELVSNDDYLEIFQPQDISQERLLRSFQYCRKALYITEEITENENLSLKRGDVLKPDFLLYAVEAECIVIVELKNLKGPTREAGTELAAYAAEVRSYLPFISDGDVVNIIISTEWPTLLRHYVAHEVFWMQRNVLCLTPEETADGLTLEIFPIEALLQDQMLLRLHPNAIGGYQLCLYDNELYGENPDKTRLDAYIPQMKAAMSAIAVTGEKHKSHGFAFLWKDNWELSLAPYSITFGNVAAFQGIGTFLLGVESLDELTEIQQRFIRLVQEYGPEGHGQSLETIVENACRFLDGFCSPRREGYTHWGDLRSIMLPRAELVSFVGWGLFGELFQDRLSKEYEQGNIALLPDSAELGLSLTDEIIDENAPHLDLTHLSLFNDLEDDFDDDPE